MTEHENPLAVTPWKGEAPAIFSTLADPKKTLNLLNSALPIGDFLSKTIAVVHIIVQDATVHDDKTNEDLPVRRTILVDKNGAAYAATSEGILQSLKLVLGLIQRTPPFDPPLGLIVNQKNTRRGFRVYVVDLA